MTLDKMKEWQGPWNLASGANSLTSTYLSKFFLKTCKWRTQSELLLCSPKCRDQKISWWRKKSFDLNYLGKETYAFNKEISVSDILKVFLCETMLQKSSKYIILMILLIYNVFRNALELNGKNTLSNAKITKQQGSCFCVALKRPDTNTLLVMSTHLRKTSRKMKQHVLCY